MPRRKHQNFASYGNAKKRKTEDMSKKADAGNSGVDVMDIDLGYLCVTDHHKSDLGYIEETSGNEADDEAGEINMISDDEAGEVDVISDDGVAKEFVHEQVNMNEAEKLKALFTGRKKECDMLVGPLKDISLKRKDREGMTLDGESYVVVDAKAKPNAGSSHVEANAKAKSIAKALDTKVDAETATKAITKPDIKSKTTKEKTDKKYNAGKSRLQIYVEDVATIGFLDRVFPPTIIIPTQAQLIRWKVEIEFTFSYWATLVMHVDGWDANDFYEFMNMNIESGFSHEVMEYRRKASHVLRNNIHKFLGEKNEVKQEEAREAGSFTRWLCWINSEKRAKKNMTQKPGEENLAFFNRALRYITVAKNATAFARCESLKKKECWIPFREDVMFYAGAMTKEEDEEDEEENDEKENDKEENDKEENDKEENDKEENDKEENDKEENDKEENDEKENDEEGEDLL